MKQIKQIKFADIFYNNKTVENSKPVKCYMDNLCFYINDIDNKCICMTPINNILIKKKGEIYVDDVYLHATLYC